VKTIVENLGPDGSIKWVSGFGCFRKVELFSFIDEPKIDNIKNICLNEAMEKRVNYGQTCHRFKGYQ
jgi:hypothetical protein